MICSLGEFWYGIFRSFAWKGQGWKLTWTPERGNFIDVSLEVIICSYWKSSFLHLELIWIWCKYIASLPWRLHGHQCLQSLPLFPWIGSCAQVVRDFRDFVTTFKVNKEDTEAWHHDHGKHPVGGCFFNGFVDVLKLENDVDPYFLWIVRYANSNILYFDNISGSFCWLVRFFCLNRLQAGAVYTKILRRFVPQPSTTPPGFSPRFRQPTCANFEKTGSRRRTQTKKCHHKKTSKKRFFCLMFTKKKGSWKNYPLKLWRNICPGPHRFL